MTSIAPIQNHVDLALGRLVTQYRSAPRVKALITSVVTRVQTVEDALGQVAAQRFLYGDTAQGAQLDDVGALAGIARNGLDDATYRVLIRGEIAKNNSNSTIEALLNVARIIFQAADVWVTSPNTFGTARNVISAEISLAIGSPKTDPALYGLLIGILQATLAGGMTLVSVVTFDAAGAFAMDGDQPWVRGPGDVADGTGGKLANLIYQDNAS